MLHKDLREELIKSGHWDDQLDEVFTSIAEEQKEGGFQEFANKIKFISKSIPEWLWRDIVDLITNHPAYSLQHVDIIKRFLPLYTKPDEFFLFIKHLDFVSGFDFPEDLQLALETAHFQNATYLLKELRELCEHHSDLYSEPSVRALLIEHTKDCDSYSLSREMTSWVYLLNSTKCWHKNKEVFLRELRHAANLAAGGLLLPRDLLDEMNLLTLNSHAEHAYLLAKSFRHLFEYSKDLYVKYRGFLLEHPAESYELAQAMTLLDQEKPLSLLNKDTLDQLTADATRAQEIARNYIKTTKLVIEIDEQFLAGPLKRSRRRLGRIGIEDKRVLLTIPKLSVSDTDKTSIGNVIIKPIVKSILFAEWKVTIDEDTFRPDPVLAKRIGEYFINYLNGQPDSLKEGDCELLCLLIILERDKCQEKLPGAMIEQSDKSLEFTLSDNASIYQFYNRTYFEKLFELNFNLLHPVFKYSQCFSIIAKALNRETQIEEPDGSIVIATLQRHILEIAVALSKRKDPIVAVHTGEKIPSLENFKLDAQVMQEEGGLQSYSGFLIMKQSVPFDQISLPELYALKKILTETDDDNFKGDKKLACICAIQKQIRKKDPDQRFFANKSVQAGVEQMFREPLKLKL